MGGKNLAIILGRVGRQPEVRYSQDGVAIANFSVATSDEWKDKNTGEKRERTEWHRVVAFKRLGEVVGEYVSKGQQVYIEGKIQTREWEDKDGNKRYTTEIVAREVQFLGGRQGSGQGVSPEQVNQEFGGPERREPNTTPYATVDDDVPF